VHTLVYNKQFIIQYARYKHKRKIFVPGILHQLIPQPSHCTYGAARLTNKYSVTNLSRRNFVRITGEAVDKDRVLRLTHKTTTWTTGGVGAAHNGCRIRVAPCLHSKTAISPRYHVNKLETSRDLNLVILLHVIKTRYPLQKRTFSSTIQTRRNSSHVTRPLIFTKSTASIIFGFSTAYFGNQDRTVGIATMLRAGQSTKLGSIPGMGRGFLIYSKYPPGLPHGNAGYIVRGVKLTIGVTWDCQEEGQMPRQCFFYVRIYFFWLLSWRGANKKIEIFSKRLFGWCRGRIEWKTCVLQDTE
jgi:hypothetical protein